VAPLPDGLTPHSLRRTFASLLFAIGEPPPWVMKQMGHTTPDLTLAIYAREMDRRDRETGTAEGAGRGCRLGTNGHQRR
jgi:integrase